MQFQIVSYASGPYVARVGIATTLLAAAYLKFAQLDFTVYADRSPDDSGRLLELILAAAELSLACWLSVGYYPRASWLAAGSCFSLFSMVALSRALRGESDCGCFGSVDVDPRQMFAVDLCITALVLLWGLPGRMAYHFTKGNAFLAYVKALACALTPVPFIFVAAILQSAPPVELIPAPTDWVGRRLPLIAHASISQNLAIESWEIVFFRPNCNLCASVLTAKQAMYEDQPYHGRSLALIELTRAAVTPRSSSIRSSMAQDRPVIAHGTLRLPDDWVIPTPLIVTTHDGIVASVAVLNSSKLHDLIHASGG